MRNFGQKKRWNLQTVCDIFSYQSQMGLIPTGVFKISLGNKAAATVVGNCPIAKFISLSVCFSWCSAKACLFVSLSSVPVPLYHSCLPPASFYPQ